MSHFCSNLVVFNSKMFQNALKITKLDGLLSIINKSLKSNYGNKHMKVTPNVDRPNFATFS